MKLVSIYCNFENIFPVITFRGNLNIIYAQVKDKHNLNKDSHNLGKSFLIEVINFCLLKQINAEHPFLKRADLFDDFEFYLEIEAHDKKFITVKRRVNKEHRYPISIHLSGKKSVDLRSQSLDQWTHPSLKLRSSSSEKGAKDTLNDLLKIDIISPYDYRKGLGYVLRTQADYDDVFQLKKFSHGKDIDWKPFVALLLGYDHDLVSKKYDLDNAKGKAVSRMKEAEKEASAASSEYDELKAIISIKQQDINSRRQLIEKFSFREIEDNINENLVENIEVNISELNQKKYLIDCELHEINHSLETEFNFDIKNIEKIFKEVEITFPDSLIHNYQDLINFNKKLTRARKERLENVRRMKLKARAAIEDDLQKLDVLRQKELSQLQEQETLNKYRQLQYGLIQSERDMNELEKRLELLNRASLYQKDIQAVDIQISETSEALREAVRSQNETLESIRVHFASYIKEVFNRNAVLFVQPNKLANLEFKVRTLDHEDQDTFEGDGSSYKKLLCVCFDIALLNEYYSKSFYHFVFHDGVFEGLDDRKKETLINLIKKICIKTNIQYIFTIIDSDIPQYLNSENALLNEDDIILRLHENGKEGRLFKMDTF